MLDSSVLAGVDNLIRNKLSTNPPNHPPPNCFAKGETFALAKLTSRQHFPEVIGCALIFI